MARMSDDKLISILRKEERAAANYQSSALMQTRTDALSYYDREPYGDEQDGASSVVTSEFADVIESIMPGLMRIFAGTDLVADFTPMQPGDERWADEATRYVPYVLFSQNEGYRVIYWLVKDALMYRLGGATVDVEEVMSTRTQAVQGLTQDAIDMIVATSRQKGAEFEMELEPDPAGTFSGSITARVKRQRVVADNIAPEDILFTPSARDQDKASFLGYRKAVTASELVLMGLPAAEVDELQSDRDLSPEETQRNDGAIQTLPERNERGDSERQLWLVVAYVRADRDGDGISEMLRVVYAHAGGTASRIVEEMEWDGPASIALASPILMSHTIVGRSLFDQTQDLQLIGSTLMRGLLDNLYMANRPRPIVDDQVNLDTLLDWVAGSPVRLVPGAKVGDAHVQWLQVPDITGTALNSLEFLATVRENRTGVVRNNQGLDADSLNKTATGMNMLMGAAQQRVELIARTLAEGGIKRLYVLLYRAIKRAAAGPQQYWTGNAFASVDPTQWPDELGLSVNVGSGSRDQAIAHLNVIGQAQATLITLQGGQANGPYVTPDNVANTASKMAQVLGYQAPGTFFQPPDKVMASIQQMAANPPATPPDPKLQAEQARAQADMAATQAKHQADLEKIQAQAMADQQRHEQDMQKLALQLQIEHLRANHQTTNLVATAHSEAASHRHDLAMGAIDAVTGAAERQHQVEMAVARPHGSTAE